jgi:hypothetical protein
MCPRSPRKTPPRFSGRSEEGSCRFAELNEQVIPVSVKVWHWRGHISKLTLYSKPAERKAYCVINDKITESIDF